MVFSSLTFLFFFLPISLLIYSFMPNNKLKNIVFLAFSLMFYFFGEPKKIIVILFSIILNYLFGLFMQSKYKKCMLLFAIFANLGVLGYFKYMNFFIETSNTLFNTNFNIPNILMPIGISFFTFQSISYIVDVYRGEVKPQKNIINLALYISMFPQLIAGPIVRYKDINNSIEYRKNTKENFSNGIDRFIFGLSKKVLLSNVFAVMADFIFNLQVENLSFSLAWFGAIAYTLQIYYDFSGYSDMAIGLGKMFGFEFMENFDFPYSSHSITEFWRRWHISLGTWFRDYVYIPLGGNKTKLHILNIFIVWILTGFWHGASFNFIIWGLYYAVLLTIEKKVKLPKIDILSNFITMFFIIIGWVIFRTENLNHAFEYISILLSPKFLIDYKMIEYFYMYWVEILIGLILIFPIFKKLEINNYIRCLLVLLLLFLCVLALITNSYNPFIYFRF